VSFHRGLESLAAVGFDIRRQLFYELTTHEQLLGGKTPKKGKGPILIDVMSLQNARCFRRTKGFGEEASAG